MARLIGNTPKRLRLQTAIGNDVDNEQFLEFSPSEAGQFRMFDDDYGAYVRRRCDPTPVYNCHGMTFASRRTGIFESSVVQQIIDEDSYEEIDVAEVLAGDIILYFGIDGDIEHSGVVIERPTEENLFIPLVCSKWGRYAELLHLSNRCPYDSSNVKYYRIRYEYKVT